MLLILGGSMSNVPAVSAKEILKNCGFSHEEVERIATVYGTDVYQAAETAEKLLELKVAKDLMFSHLLSDRNIGQRGRNTGQRAVQSIIKSVVSEKDDTQSYINDSNCDNQSEDASAESNLIASQHSSSSSLDGLGSLFYTNKPIIVNIRTLSLETISYIT